MFYLRAFILSAVLLLSGVTTTSGQWTQVFTYPSFVRTIHFVEGQSQIAFVGTANGEVFKSTDQGASWQSCAINTGGISISEFTFKDAQIGWLTTKDLFSGSTQAGLYMTGDGGLTWTPLNYTGTLTSVHYNRASRLLFLSDWTAGALSSNDDGQTFNVISDRTSYFNGIQFADDQHGIIAPAGSGGFILVTSDAGLTWSHAQPDDETWQPASSASGHFYELSEQTNHVYLSTDHGNNWSPGFYFSSSFATGLTGCLRSTSCGELYTQSQNDGFFRSTDEGNSWSAIGGPGCDIDSRFWIEGSKIFAADKLGGLFTLTLTGSQGNFSLSASRFIYQIKSCPARDSILHFSIRSCAGIGDSLLDAHIVGSTGFKLVHALPIPRKTLFDDSLTVEYTPTSTSDFDTATLLLRFTLNGQTTDVLIPLSARKPSLQVRSTMRFDGARQETTIAAPPDTIDVVIALDDTLANPYVTDMDYRLKYDGDVLTPVGNGLSYQNWNISNFVVAPGQLSFHLHRGVLTRTIKDSAIARLSFRTTVARNAYSSITMPELRFANDSALENCTQLLSTQNDSITVHLKSVCRDTTLRTALRNQPLIDLLRITPSPASDHVVISVALARPSEISIAMYDLLGKQVGSWSEGSLSTGLHDLLIPITLPSSGYVISIRTDTGAQVSKRIVISK